MKKSAQLLAGGYGPPAPPSPPGGILYNTNGLRQLYSPYRAPCKVHTWLTRDAHIIVEEETSCTRHYHSTTLGSEVLVHSATNI